ncbi:hypothetical protein AC249_AIPGENE10313 [Exaiptasia diaphana]|nr:hypothetical protein AC249_AIPGENE10313 [Exaiptasia diaphana]
MSRAGDIADETASRGHGGSQSFAELKSFIEGLLESFKNDMKRANDEAITKAVKRTRQEALKASRLVKDDLNHSGWKFNVKKSNWEPRQLGLLRCDEIVNITRRDVCIKADHMTVFCLKRKNDQYSKGHTAVIDRSGKITCPVAITEKLLNKLPVCPNQSLVCRLKSNGSAMQQSISYSRVREIFLETMSEFVEDSKLYGTHSLDRFAGWKSARSKFIYISDSDEKLRVSKAINL